MMTARISGWRRCAAAIAIIAIAIGAGGIAMATTGNSTGGSAIVPLGPTRILDTRNGTGGASAPLGPDSAHKLTVAGVAGVPQDATGVLLNVTAVNGTMSSFLTVYPAGMARPETSNLNWSDADAHPNMVSVSIGTNGAIDFYNSAGQVDLIVDLAGYFIAIAPTPPPPPTTTPLPAPANNASALTAEAIVESYHEWLSGPLPFNTTDTVVGTDISHDATAAPESFYIARAGIYRVDYDVNDEGCCAWDGTFAVTVNGTAINPVSAIGNSGPEGGGGINHTVVVDVATDNSVLQLVLNTSSSLYSGYAGGGEHSLASITIQRIGDRP